MISIVQPSLMDPKERKRQRERDRYAQLSFQQKDDLLKRRREARQQNKVVAIFVIKVQHHGQMEPKQFVPEELQHTPTSQAIDWGLRTPRTQQHLQNTSHTFSF